MTNKQWIEFYKQYTMHEIFLKNNQKIIQRCLGGRKNLKNNRDQIIGTKSIR